VAVPKIYYNEKLLQAIENSIAEAFNPRYVRLSRKSSKVVGRFNSVLQQGDREFRASDAEGPQNVIEIRLEGVSEEVFWLAFKANFDLWEKGAHFLEHISLSVFQQSEAGDLVRMFRAEWDSRAASDSASKHAQPHWHFAMEEDDFRAVFPIAEEGSSMPLGSFDSKPASQLVDFSTFHFAMSPLWFSGTPACHRQQFQSEEELKNWFSNLSVYIAEQLTYVSQKAGAGSTATEFRSSPNSI
jgi:hypothetical protein